VAYYLAIDGGGTKTRCILADEAKILASAMTGGCSIIRQGEQQARESLHAAIRQVCGSAGISPSQINSVYIGVTGAARPEIAGKIRKIVAELIDGHSAKIAVVPDTEIALDAAFGEGSGVVVISGTGSIAFGRSADQRTARAGGWGFAISDEGSGYWIGRRAVAAVLNAQDEDRSTTLLRHVTQAWGVDGLDEIVQLANATPPPEFARLFAVVLRAWHDDGDVVACEILVEAGEKLADLTRKVMRKLSPSSRGVSAGQGLESGPTLPLALTGSVFRQSSVVREVFQKELRKSFPGIEARESQVEPIEGALARARRM
jgi:glucosamine kinase